MISKELLSTVLDLHITNISEPEKDSNSIAYTCTENSAWDLINIYELAHKCKEYAFSKGYQIVSFKSDNSWICRDIYKPYLYEGADTEEEAVFKVCTWVYNHEGVK